MDLGFGIAEILPTGQCFITKSDTSHGVVNKFNATAQLLYELQGELYLNPDVVADISSVKIENTAQVNRVAVSGVKGLPPPATTKAMISAKAGYQCETTFYINGLDVAEKAEMMKNQLGYMFKDCNFSKLSIELYGTPAQDPKSQQAGTVFLRVFAQARKKEDVSASKFRNIVYALRMQSYPGMTYTSRLNYILKANRIPHESRLPNNGPKTVYGDLSSDNPSIGNLPPSSRRGEDYRYFSSS